MKEILLKNVMLTKILFSHESEEKNVLNINSNSTINAFMQAFRIQFFLNFYMKKILLLKFYVLTKKYFL